MFITNRGQQVDMGPGLGQVPFGPEVDRDRYFKVCRKAIGDIANVFNAHVRSDAPPERFYEAFLEIDTKARYRSQIQRKSVQLVKEICRLLKFQDRHGKEIQMLDVDVLSIRPGEAALRPGFVSWLQAEIRRSESDKSEWTVKLTIIFDPEQFKDAHLPNARCDCAIASQERLLAKALMHECGHASLHLKELSSRIRKNPWPSLDAEHEADAWLYSSTIWGVLIGDHGQATHPSGDKAWCLA